MLAPRFFRLTKSPTTSSIREVSTISLIVFFVIIAINYGSKIRIIPGKNKMFLFVCFKVKGRVELGSFSNFYVLNNLFIKKFVLIKKLFYLCVSWKFQYFSGPLGNSGICSGLF